MGKAEEQQQHYEEDENSMPPQKRSRNSNSNCRDHFPFVNSNVSINQSRRPATMSFTGPESGSPSVKEETPPLKVSNYINLKLNDQNANEVMYSIKRTTRLNKILEAYSEHHNLEKGSVKLIFDGRYCQGYQTPNDLGIEDNDEISVVINQDGGS